MYLVRHTYYSIQFHFSCEKPPLRLQLREELHDMVKEELGKEYATVFAQAPFAKRGGLAGTTGLSWAFLGMQISISTSVFVSFGTDLINCGPQFANAILGNC